MRIGLMVRAVVLLLWLNPAGACAEEVLALDLQQVLDLARTQNPYFQAKKLDLNIAQSEVQTAGLLDNPILLTDNGTGERTYRLGVKQVVPMSRKRHHEIGVAQAKAHATQSTIDTVWLDLRAEVRRAYVRLFYAQQRDDLIEKSHQNLMELLTKAGNPSKKDEMQANLQLVQTANRLETARAEVFEAQSVLDDLMNKPFSLICKLSPPPGFEPEDNELDLLVQQAMARRPELQHKFHDMDTAKSQLKFAKSNRVPDLWLTVGPDLVTEPEPQAWGVFVMASMDIPLFNRQQGEIQKFQARQLQVEYEQTAISNNIVMQVRNTYAAFMEHRAQVGRYESDILPKAQALAHFTQSSLGKEVGLSDAVRAETTHLEVSLDYLKALLDYQNSVTNLERAVGIGL